MFAVLFEVFPRSTQWDTYLDRAKTLGPELERIEGFIDNIRYKSLTRDGWILSLSIWQDEKALVRWRTKMHHHQVQEEGRNKILADYHLRVGQVTQDTKLPSGQSLQDQRMDITQVGEGTTVSLITAKRPEVWPGTSNAADCAEYLGLNPYADGMAFWDVFEAVLTPGDLILMLAWRDATAAAEFEDQALLPAGARLRQVRVLRDYGMFDRREAPQYYPEQTRDEDICSH
jgi:heme-degrading monooxygenase HmoA